MNFKEYLINTYGSTPYDAESVSEKTAAARILVIRFSEGVRCNSTKDFMKAIQQMRKNGTTSERVLRHAMDIREDYIKECKKQAEQTFRQFLLQNYGAIPVRPEDSLDEKRIWGSSLATRFKALPNQEYSYDLLLNSLITANVRGDEVHFFKEIYQDWATAVKEAKSIVEDAEKTVIIDPKSDAVTQGRIDYLMNSAIIDVKTVFNKCTVVALKTIDGFVIVESSSCIDEADYDEEVGKEICLKKIESKLWELEGYRIQHKILEGLA